ncbi:MAG: DNA ligase D, partial [Myxococcota bacterium]
VQQHAARRLHWDLRLEIGPVLASWAVPRGPSLNPQERRLAVRTEDHPLEYADFEGVIPEGNYGAGAMIVWDAGSYRTVDGSAPDAGLDSGKLDLVLEGHKLRGRFALVRTKGEGGREWLLLKKGAKPAVLAEPVVEMPASVLSGLDVEELARGASRDADVRRRLRGVPEDEVDAAALRPMLADRADAPFSDPRWLFELKYDGVRVLAERRGSQVRLFARSGAERTDVYPEVARAVARLPLGDFVLDGELVALDATGRSSFERLQRRWTQTDPRVVARLEVEIPTLLYAFDLLRADGRNLRGLPLTRRKQILSLFAPRVGVVRFADHVEGDGEALFAAAAEQGLEGVVAKRADAPYEAGRRSRRWLKLRVPRSADLVVVGWVPGKGSRADLGALMLAWQREGELVYVGNVGSGFDDATLGALRETLPALRVDAPAFRGAPDPPVRGTAYVRPELVCEVRYTEVTSIGSLRQPVFLRLRPDKPASECDAPSERSAAAETLAPAAPAPSSEHDLDLTRLDKIFWPTEGYTKGDLLAYYERAWPWLEPYLRDRPVVLTRYPDGIEGKHFYQKNAPDFTPEWATRREIDGTDYFICNDLRTLLYVINSGAIPLHVWSARLADLERPDWLILDLDPKQAPFAAVIEVARCLHRLLDALGAAHVVKTSGQAGLHVLLPLGGRLAHAESRALAEVLARVVVAELPKIATVTRPVAARGDKVYVDYLQNGRGQLLAAPFSVRPRPGAPVSMPLTWRQVTARLDPGRWTIKTALSRVEKHGDPVLRVLGEGVDAEAILAALAERLAEEVG